MNKIKAVALNLHDHNTYDGVWHNQRERHTRFKHNLPYYAEAYAHQSDKLNPNDYRLNDEFIEEYFKKPNEGVLAFSCTAGGIRKSKEELLQTILKDHNQIFNYVPTKLFDNYYKDEIYYIDHHQSHATYAFINSGFNLRPTDIAAAIGLNQFKRLNYMKDIRTYNKKKIIHKFLCILSATIVVYNIFYVVRKRILFN